MNFMVNSIKRPGAFFFFDFNINGYSSLSTMVFFFGSFIISVYTDNKI